MKEYNLTLTEDEIIMLEEAVKGYDTVWRQTLGLSSDDSTYKTDLLSEIIRKIKAMMEKK